MEIDNEMTFGDSTGEDELSVENLTKEVLYHYKKISKELFLENRAVSYLFQKCYNFLKVQGSKKDALDQFLPILEELQELSRQTIEVFPENKKKGKK